MGLDPIILKQVEEIVRNAHAQGRDVLFEYEVYSVLRQLGMRVPEHFIVRKTSDISGRLLAKLGSSKVVMKVVSSQITHKQGLGGVRIVVKDTEFVRYTFDQRQHRPHHPHRQCRCQTQRPGRGLLQLLSSQHRFRGDRVRD
jgi:acyl-CoA synthetase (NDP forming)